MVFVGAGTGNVARVPDDQAYFLGPNIAMIRVEQSYVSGAYLEMFLRSPVGHALTFGFIKAVAQPSLSMGTIRMIPVALPPSLRAEADRGGSGTALKRGGGIGVVGERQPPAAATLASANPFCKRYLQEN